MVNVLIQWLSFDERLNKVFLKIRKSELQLNKNKCQIGVKSIVFFLWRCKSWPSKNWSNHENVITEFCKWTPTILRHDHILRKINTKSRKSILSSLHPAKEKLNLNLRNPRYNHIGELKLLVTTTPGLKIFIVIHKPVWKLMQALKDQVLFWNQPSQKLNLPKTVTCRICITITSRLRKTLRPNRKGNPFYRFWCWETPWISLWTQIHSNQWPPAIKINL